MRILGISAFYHDSAAAIVEDGLVVAAAQEERFTRRKQDSRFPESAIRSCLQQRDISLDDVDTVAFYDKPHRKFARLASTYLSFAPLGFQSFIKAMPLWLENRFHQREQVLAGLNNLGMGGEEKHQDLAFLEHHQSHAASAFYPSPYENAAVLTLDGVGEWATTTVAIGSGSNLEIVKEIYFPHSVGLMYSAFTYYLGFKVNSGEYKVMGLAPYGEPKYLDKIFEELIDLKKDGSFRLNQKYFDYCTGLRMINKSFEELFAAPSRTPESLLTQFHMDVAASVQAACEEIVLKIVRGIKQETHADNLCLAGGVALNCVANGRILREGLFDSIWIQPAAGDAGGALGAALGTYYALSGAQRTMPANGGDGMSGSFLGPQFSQAQIQAELEELGAVHEIMTEEVLIRYTANAISEGAAVGWFQVYKVGGISHINMIDEIIHEENVKTDTLIELIKAKKYNVMEYFGDPAGSQAQGQSGLGDIEIFRRNGIIVKSVRDKTSRNKPSGESHVRSFIESADGSRRFHIDEHCRGIQ